MIFVVYRESSVKAGTVAESEAVRTGAAGKRYTFIPLDMADPTGMAQLFERHAFDAVVNLGAQAGVRYSIDNPNAYVDSNVVGFVNVLEGCRHSGVKHLVYASSSSVYGMNVKQPFSTADRVDYPISLYAATKKSNELMAHTYSHLFNIPTTGLRFFTVYGPWGRPDMAYFKFTKAILAGRPIDVYNHGNMHRDFTYIDDIVEGILRVLAQPPQGDCPHTLYNIGNHQPVELMTFISTIEQALGREAEKIYLPMQDGDVPITYADTQKLRDAVGFSPDTPLADGMRRFVDWYRAYHQC